MQELLKKLIEQNRPYTKDGVIASYIPELSKVQPGQLGIAVVETGGGSYFAGDFESPFTIQSICKVPVLLAAFLDNSMEELSKTISMAPTADGFNSIVSLELKNNQRPLNPMINAGAIACLSMVKGADMEEKYLRVFNLLQKISRNDGLMVNHAVYLSEKQTGDRNRALAYYMKSTGIIDCDVGTLLDAYFRLCSITVTCKDIAHIGAFLAAGGELPDGTVLASPHICRIVKAVMSTCGMYDGSGDFAISVGLPAKSGVGGGIMAVSPKRFGIGVFSAELDAQGNSLAGKMLLESLSHDLDLSVF